MAAVAAELRFGCCMLSAYRAEKGRREHRLTRSGLGSRFERTNDEGDDDSDDSWDRDRNNSCDYPN